VDCGGDSLTGGLDFSADIECGRDRQVLRALQAIGIPFLHMIFAPGCDGESTIDAMKGALEQAHRADALLGWWSLKEDVQMMAPLCENLAANRTPNIIRDVVHKLEQNPESASELCPIYRHGAEAHIPVSWLVNGVVLDGKRDYLC